MHIIDIDKLLSHMTPRDEFVLRKFYCIGVRKRTRLALLGPEVNEKWPGSKMDVRQILDRANRRLFQRFLEAAKQATRPEPFPVATSQEPPSTSPQGEEAVPVRASLNATRVDPSGADSDHSAQTNDYLVPYDPATWFRRWSIQ